MNGLEANYEDPLIGAMQAAATGTPVVGLTSNTVPWEPFVAAGCFPVVLNPRPGSKPGPPSSTYMEPVFEQRIRAIFDQVMENGSLIFRSVVIPRTSEQEHKLYLYLREVAREGAAPAMPEIHLYNLLHARSPESERFGRECTVALCRYAEAIQGTSLTEASLAHAIGAGNRVRGALRKLHALRLSASNPLSGVEAMQWTGASYFMDRSSYAQQLEPLLIATETRPRRAGKRLLLKGASLAHSGLHQAIEAHAATVVAEDDWWGARSAIPDTEEQQPPVEAIFQSCYRHTASQRIYPPAVADDWFLSRLSHVDAVVFFLPFEDDVYGWDYPRWKRSVDQRGLSSFIVREDGHKGMSVEWHEQFESFLAKL